MEDGTVTTIPPGAHRLLSVSRSTESERGDLRVKSDRKLRTTGSNEGKHRRVSAPKGPSVTTFSDVLDLGCLPNDTFL